MPNSNLFLDKKLLLTMFDFAREAIIEEKPDFRDPDSVVPKCYARGFIMALLSCGYKVTIEKENTKFVFQQGVNFDIE